MNVSEDRYIEMRKSAIKFFETHNYADEIEKWMEERWQKIKEFQYQEYGKIKEWQLKQIRELVDYAYDNIPLYKKKYSKVGYKKGSIKTWEDFKKLPLLYKEEIIEGFPDDIVKDQADLKFTTRSSGSSGEFLTMGVSLSAIYIDTIQGIRQFLTQSEKRYKEDDVVLFIYTCPWWISEVNGKFKLDFLPTTASIEEALEKIKAVRPKIISTYPTYLQKIASENININDYGVELVIIHSEQSSRAERDMLEEALNVKVLDEYSSEELTRIALECEKHQYHLEEDSCYIEAVNPDTKQIVDYGETGIIVGTNLINKATPIIRYYQGDLAKLEEPHRCKCGKNTRTIQGILGRYMDSIITPEKTIIPASCFMDIAYNWFLENDIPVHGLRYQFVQQNENALELYISKGIYNIDFGKIRESLYQLIPKSMSINVHRVTEMPKRKGIKYRPVVNLLMDK